MKKVLLALIASMLFISACGGSSNSIGTISNNYGNTITMGDSMIDLYDSLENLAYDSTKPPLDDGMHYFDGIEINARDGIVRILSIAEMHNLYDSKTVWQTSEGIKIGSTKEEVLEAYSFIKTDEWSEESELSPDTNGNLQFSKEVGKRKCTMAFSFDDDNEVTMIIIFLFGE